MSYRFFTCLQNDFLRSLYEKIIRPTVKKARDSEDIVPIVTSRIDYGWLD